MQKLKSWKLESFYDDEKYAVLPADDSVPRAFYPLGRNIWKVSKRLLTTLITAKTEMVKPFKSQISIELLIVV